MGCFKLEAYRNREEHSFEGVWKKSGQEKEVANYYPFGLTFNSYQRENSVANRWKFQGQEHIDDLDLGWDSFKWRNHDPSIGRFFNVDPLADKYVYNSPYAFSENHVTAHVELEGLEKVPVNEEKDKGPLTTSGPYAGTDGNGTASAHIAKVNMDVPDAGVHIEVTVGEVKAEARGEVKNGVKGEAAVSGKALGFATRNVAGSEENNFIVGIDTKAGAAEAYASGEVSTAGLSVDVGAGAYSGSAKGTVGFTVFGVTFEATGEATGGSAHIGVGGTFKPNANSGENKIRATGNFGFGVGFGLDLSISW